MSRPKHAFIPTFVRRAARSAALATTVLAAVAGAAADDQPMIGEEAPPIRLTSLDGDVVELADYRGKIVVLHFGTSW